MTDECIDPIELFKFEAYHEDPEVQMRAVKKLPTLAVALDVDRTRHELVSCLEDFMDTMYFQNDEILTGLAEQLGNFSPFLGGPQYAHILFPMLDRLALSEDVITRDKAVESLQQIASLMDREHLEMHFVPLIHKLTTAKWCYSKCSAAGLFAICYPKVSEDEKAELRNLFFRLLGDESPAVRRAAIGKMSEFVKVVEIQYLKDEFVAEFIQLADDEQDSVRLLNVYIAIAIAARLNTQEIEDYMIDTIKNISADKSWRVRYQFANEINNIQMAVGPSITRKSIVPLYKNLVHDTEANIREISARKIVNFCELLQKTYYAQSEEPKDLDPVIKSEMFSLIKELDQDVAEDVQDGLYSVITSLSSLLGETNTKEFLLPLITSSLENGSPKVKENIIANLNNIICIVDINCLTDKVRQLISEMVDTTATYWRIRRNLIVTLSHIANHSKKEYFNEHLKPLYVKLLNDAVYGVRKVAPLILPVLMKNFGVAWAKESIIPTFIEFHDHTYYLFRMMCLFGIDELIKPTLQTFKPTENHLSEVEYLRNITATNANAIQILYKISVLNNFLQERLQDEWVRFVLNCSEDDEYFHDDVKTYAEDTIEEFTKTGDFDILTVNSYEIENQGEEESYLEGLLYFCIVEFLPTIRKMAQDKVVNVCLRAVNSLKTIRKFNSSLFEELSADHMVEMLQRLSKEDAESLRASMEMKLRQHIKSEESPVEKQNVAVAVGSCGDSGDNSLDGETIIFSKEELSNIEQIIFSNIDSSAPPDEEQITKQEEERTKPEDIADCDSTPVSITKNESESETNFMEY